MTALSFTIADWRAWAPGLETQAAWRSWAGRAPLDAAPVEWPAPTLPAMLRRRIGVLAQRAIAAALGCKGVAQCRYVFASRHAELDRTISILDSIAAGETPSPTEFSMSVHHALAGLLSIHTGNREGHTAVAAGVDSFGFGFMEAAAYVAAEAKPALLVYYDAPFPDEYRAFEEPGDKLPLVVALQLEPARSDGLGCSFAPAPAAAGGGEVSTTAAPFEFLRFLLNGEDTAVSIGRRMTWRWRRDD